MYIIVEGKLTSAEFLPLVREALTRVVHFEGNVPGTASTKECGWVALHSLELAKKEAEAYLKALEQPVLEYPV
jgi:S-ribosylhomocysteine lyase LuxS involved in autoinducer biosynthesis